MSRRRLATLGLVTTSLACHGLVWLVAPYATSGRPTFPPAEIEVRQTMAPPIPVKPSAVESGPQRASTSIPQGVKRARNATRLVRVPDPTPITSVDVPADFGNLVLTNEDAGAEPTGTGRPTPAAAVAPPPAPPAPPAPPDLSRPPKPPPLEAALAANYPAAARANGQRGLARVRAEIGRDGGVRALTVVAQSATGFGEACLTVLKGSRWEPARGRDGRPMATEVAFTCRFEVSR